VSVVIDNDGVAHSTLRLYRSTATITGEGEGVCLAHPTGESLTLAVAIGEEGNLYHPETLVV